MTNESDRFYGDPDNVRKVELLHENPSREHVRVTVQYVRGPMKVFTVDRSLLTLLLKELHAMQSEPKAFEFPRRPLLGFSMNRGI